MPSFGVDLLLDDPFFTGTAPSADVVPALLPCALGGHPYLVELSQYERQTIERFRNPYDVSIEPGEHTLNYKGPWLRSTSRWNLGAGQDFWDLTANDVNRQRFRTSKGIDAMTRQNRLQLLNDTRNIKSTGSANAGVLSVGGFLYAIDGQQLYWTADPTGASPTWTSAVINHGTGPNTITSVTTDGTNVYAALGPGFIAKTALGASSSSAFNTTLAATLIGYANGNFLAAVGNVLSTVDNAGAATTLFTHRNSSFVWTTICAAPNGIYVGGNAGDRNEIYFITLKSDNSLNPPTFAANLPYGETLNYMVFYEGFFILCTSLGIRLAQVVSTFGLAFGKAVEIAGGVMWAEPNGAYAWFAWKNFDGVSTGLGRLDMGTVSDIDALVAAYQSDLMATAQGAVNSVASFGGKRYFGINGLGIYGEFTDKVATGYLYQGWLNYSTNELKVPISVDIRHEPLAGTIHIDLLSEAGTLESVGDSITPASLGPITPLSVPTISSESFEVQITLNRSGSDHTQGPVLRRWTLRALITPKRVDQISLPLRFEQIVRTLDASGGQEYAMDLLDEWLYLKSLETAGAPVVYQFGTRSELVYIESVAFPKDPDRKWIPDRSFAQGLMLVQLVTLDPAA